MPTHFPERPISWALDRKVHAIWSRDPSRKAIVFIHGYGGNAITTWSDFHVLLPDEPKSARYDLIFYDYDGLRTNTIASAAIFRKFLDFLFGKPAGVINTSLPASAARDVNFGYDEVLLVAHSLGAVICRWALLQARDSSSAWPAKTRLILFAPAHMGASVMKLAGAVLTGLPGLLLGIIRFKSPLIDELDVNSEALKALRTDTLKALSDGKSSYLTAKTVIQGEYDNIVQTLKFCNDPPPIPFSGKNHITVCKPNESFLDPLLEVVKLL
jgi:pimeloyl-ACP methyl ester carboxylesterase